ncbi:hypothetical protein LAZ67_12000343 [Cordylochernes scorpioides]|uniref:Helitron helicase-like domain-containing protein n=1 Tax=Cordylochernes scorpioides TaxID=51811 RepID=A0ABY6L0F9_9ARAC|nr:hypothetical protein LAZ67_12000343 [Cordylochernes scorpioides]
MASTSERNQSESDMDCDEKISDLSDTSDTEIYSYHDTDSEQNSEADEELPNDDSEFYFGKDGVTKWKKTIWQKTQIHTRSVNIISQLPGPKSEAKSIESIPFRGSNFEKAGIFIGETNAKTVWDELKRIHTGNIEDKIIDIGLELKNIQMRNNEGIEAYISRARNIASRSANLGQPISPREMVYHVVKGFVRALRWKDESSGMCCSNGKVRLPLIDLPPEPLRSLLSGENSDSVHFLRNIRKYNSCFQMTSFGAEKQTHSVTFPTTFSIQGQVYHRIGSLMPSENQPSRFLQIYFVGNDDDIQTDRRCQQIQGVRRNIVQGLQRMLHQHNLLVQQFKTALENLPSDAYRVVVNADRTPPGQHPRPYNAPTANEVAVVLAGQEGYSFHIPQIDPNTRQPLSSKVSSMDFYGYFIMVRRNSPNVIVQFGQLFHQFLVDMYAKVESERLRYITLHQRNLRAESYIHLRDALSTDANINPNSLGQRIILPSSFVNSPRYLAEYTQDAFCYVRKFGRPDLFITFTSNPSWEELSAALLPGQKQLDRHDITARVFRQKFVQFIGALTKGQLYGTTVAWMYSVEWQKMGLPHAHILVWLANKLRPTQIDSVICAEFPDPIQDPLLYNIVVKNMIHGPCGEYNPVSPCMKNSSCSKKYPKQFLLETQTNVLQARILTGSFRGEEVLIPRIPIIPNDLPFKFRRLQFPVMVAFAMTINKSQGQTLQVVGVHLESPCFSHRQLYVACSRVSSPKNLFVFSSTFSKTRNIVYQGALI